MMEPVVFVTIKVRNVGGDNYPVTINLHHVKTIMGNHITLTDNLGYELTEESASSLREIIDRYCWTHNCRR